MKSTPRYSWKMGSRYKRNLEIEWEGKPISAMRIKTMQDQADRNLTKVSLGRYKRKGGKK